MNLSTHVGKASPCEPNVCDWLFIRIHMCSRRDEVRDFICERRGTLLNTNKVKWGNVAQTSETLRIDLMGKI
jgi:hypothetical protein